MTSDLLYDCSLGSPSRELEERYPVLFRLLCKRVCTPTHIWDGEHSNYVVALCTQEFVHLESREREGGREREREGGKERGREGWRVREGGREGGKEEEREGGKEEEREGGRVRGQYGILTN